MARRGGRCRQDLPDVGPALVRAVRPGQPLVFALGALDAVAGGASWFVASRSPRAQGECPGRCPSPPPVAAERARRWHRRAATMSGECPGRCPSPPPVAAERARRWHRRAATMSSGGWGLAQPMAAGEAPPMRKGGRRRVGLGHPRRVACCACCGQEPRLSATCGSGAGPGQRCRERRRGCSRARSEVEACGHDRQVDGKANWDPGREGWCSKG